MTLTEARAQFTRVVEQVDRTHERVEVTRNGHSAVVIISRDDLENLQETIAVLSDPATMRDLAEAASEDPVTRLRGAEAHAFLRDLAGE